MGNSSSRNDIKLPETRETNNSQAFVSGNSAYMRALERGDINTIRSFYRSKTPLIPALPLNQSILHYAVSSGQHSLLKSILSDSSTFKGIKNMEDDMGRTALHLAVLKIDVESVAILLKYNARIKRDSQGKTPMELLPRSLDLTEIRELFQAHFESESLNVSKSTEETTHRLESSIPIINDLVFGDLIRRGPSSSVYKGTWRGTEVAIKQFVGIKDERDKEKFLKEIRALGDVRHPNLILLMGVSVDDMCIVTEFMSNGSLFEALHPDKLRMEQKIEIAIQICKAITYLHSSSPPIVHRDLKPENCILDYAFNVKIADFGLARPVSALFSDDATTKCIGTARFMAPELMHKGTVGTEVDIWALGCLFIELFSGQRPWKEFSRDQTNCIFYQLFSRKPVPIPEEIPAPFKDMIQECCRYNPRRRPKAEDILQRFCKVRSLIEY